ncbi:uncharacterized protein LOC131148324 [Malania oleifera]|uniref:uncharacterized protein LOC131148324 n=1 Tax=Malania oleifera TaxID=397392 RepID=UPI0025AE2A3C|nr:uncharacterized protein LOC131148324 [Malania oleifera]
MWCYVGKATKIFIFLLTAFVVIGLVLGFGLIRHSIRKAHNCSGDSCPQTTTTSPTPNPIPIPSQYPPPNPNPAPNQYPPPYPNSNRYPPPINNLNPPPPAPTTAAPPSYSPPSPPFTPAPSAH